MGSTRRRVTILVLALESIGFVLLAFALWLAGEARLRCTAEAGQQLSCEFEERRLVYLWPFREADWRGVKAATVGGEVDPARRSILLRTAAGEFRTLLGGAERTTREVAALENLRLSGGEPVLLVRSDLGWALLAAVFGLTWLLVISLIMREFLGFHTPWWWRLFQPRAG